MCWLQICQYPTISERAEYQQSLTIIMNQLICIISQHPFSKMCDVDFKIVRIRLFLCKFVYYLSHHPSINYKVRCLQHSKASHIWWLFRLFMFIKTTFKLNVFEEVQVVLFDLFVQMLTEQDTDTDINVSWYYLLQFNVHSSSHSAVTPSTFPSCKSILFPRLAFTSWMEATVTKFHSF